MAIIYCPYCKREAEFLSNSQEVYNGHDFGPIYLCRPCWAWVGCHKDTLRPLGRLANNKLRQARQAAHNAFDPIWKSKRLTRGSAYKWLSDQLGLPLAKTHIGMFGPEKCQRVVNICCSQDFEELS